MECRIRRPRMRGRFTLTLPSPIEGEGPRRVRRPAAHTLYKPYVRPLSPAIGCSRRVLCLPQWICPPTATSRPRGTQQNFASSTPTDYQSLTCSAGVYPPRKTPYIPRPRGINPRATQPDAKSCQGYGAHGSIADAFGVCQYILKPFTAEARRPALSERLALSLSPLDHARGDPECVEGSKGASRRDAAQRAPFLTWGERREWGNGETARGPAGRKASRGPPKAGKIQPGAPGFIPGR